METTLIVCDYCSKQLKINCVFIEGVSNMVTIDVIGKGKVHCCEGCSKIYEDAYSEVLNKVQKGLAFTVENRMFIVNNLISASDDDIKKHFGTSGLKLKHKLIEDLQKE